ncbi:MAG TPA: hydantoinase B/oxoprolinase family protein [Gaiellaceae bacterium]|nr:hydantoinase B/oxoprolinase family protein [Gaiellaceae bacterium]
MNVRLQVLGYALRAVAEEMGAALIRSAFSANIKERRDCSTAIFDPSGRMVAQAEHIPVHLGAMPASVAAVIACDPGPDDVFVLNDPYSGGTHLPDVTLVSRTELGWAATRAHHADVGGAVPGSMPAGSRTLAEEGVVIPPTRLDEATLEELVAQMRNPDERRGDLRAQLAAQRLGARRIAELCARRGRDEVAAAMDELVAYSERRVRAGIAALPDGRWEAVERLETADGELELRVAAIVAGDELVLDFAGTAPQHVGNLNCPLAVTVSACLFVVRVLTDPDVPASAGALAPVTVVAPEGCLVNARPPAAVAAGNVETSSRIVDLLFRAFGRAVPVPAQGQGTMNNVVLGNERFTYYETIGGGQGACPDADGPSGVHVAMSNTLSTPTEALELGYPLRVERHALRLGSGGEGVHAGGDGVIRELRVLEACRLSLLSQRRRIAPAGAEGGGPGAPGRSLLDGEELPPLASRELSAGDVLRIETPGGGGYGSR